MNDVRSAVGCGICPNHTFRREYPNMRQRRLASVVAGITAAFALTAAPARAGDPVFVPESFGEGAVVGTLTCAPDGVTSITIDSPAFVFDGELGELHATGTVNCHEPNQLSNA